MQRTWAQLVCAGSTKCGCKAGCDGLWLCSFHGPEGTCPAVTLSSESLVLHVWHCGSAVQAHLTASWDSCKPFPALSEMPFPISYPLPLPHRSLTHSLIVTQVSHIFLPISLSSALPNAHFHSKWQGFLCVPHVTPPPARHGRASCLLSQLYPISTPTFLCRFYPAFHLQSLLQMDLM